MRGDAEQASVESDIEVAGIGVGEGEGELVGVVQLAEVHGGRGGQGGPGGIRTEKGIGIGEGAMSFRHHALHLVAHAVGRMPVLRRRSSAELNRKARELEKR